MTTAPATDKNLRLYLVALKNTYTSIGAEVFEFQPLVIQRALIAESILDLINAQDEDGTSDKRVREMVAALIAINGQWHGPMTSRWAWTAIKGLSKSL